MGAVHRRNIELHGAAGDLVRWSRVVTTELARDGQVGLATWLQQGVLAVVQRVVEGTDVEAALDRVTLALRAAGGHLGPVPSVLHMETAVTTVRRWWRLDPIRDGPPTVVRLPMITRETGA